MNRGGLMRGFRGRLRISRLAVIATLFAAVVVIHAPVIASGYTPHAPIYINGDAAFIAANGVISGSGTWDDPYVVAGWEIDTSTAEGIYIINTNAHFVIRDCHIRSTGNSGVFLQGVRNGVVENN